MPTLVLINGLPGTGKTTIASRLSPDLDLPCMSKDKLKEFFFDEMHSEGREQSRMYGRITSRALYILAEEFLADGRSLMLESAFFAEFAREEFRNIFASHPARVIEIHCSTEPSVRRERFRTRHESGQRHQGHHDGTDLSRLSPDDPEPHDKYAPLEIGELVKVDTTEFGEAEYQELLEKMKGLLRGKS